MSLLATDGFKDWKNLSHRLKSHETSDEHISCMKKWIELSIRLERDDTIEKCAQELIKKEREHWKQVLINYFSFYVVCFL